MNSNITFRTLKEELKSVDQINLRRPVIIWDAENDKELPGVDVMLAGQAKEQYALNNMQDISDNYLVIIVNFDNEFKDSVWKDDILIAKNITKPRIETSINTLLKKIVTFPTIVSESKNITEIKPIYSPPKIRKTNRSHISIKFTKENTEPVNW